MNRRSFLQIGSVAGIGLGLPAVGLGAEEKKAAGTAGAAANPKTGSGAGSPNSILLKDYRPRSIYKIPVTRVDKARHPIIDMHSHPYAKDAAEIEQWVRTMDEVGIEKTMILTMATGAEFDEISRRYSKFPERFELWCGLDLSGYKGAGFPTSAVKELERCHAAGARGIGEIHDKGKGLKSGNSNAPGMHPDDARMNAVWDKAGELKMPVSLHVADPIWMYEPMDKHNDGLMNAYEWRLDNQPNIVKLPGMVEIFERLLEKHRGTTFIACHFMNLDYDLGHLGEVLERHPNLYADISARYAETAPIPRFAAAFYAKHAGRLVYGTDMGFDPEMYRVTFRILESADEHFYEFEQFGYHWALNGFGLGDDVLKSVYRENAGSILGSSKG
jgi:uncharacterized protein